MPTIVVVLVVIAFVGLVALAHYFANYSLTVASSFAPEQARVEVLKCFITQANRIVPNGQGLEITPKYKKDAPTLHVEISPRGGGATVEMHGSYTSEKRGILPWIPINGFWIFRKQRKIANRVGTP